METWDHDLDYIIQEMIETVKNSKDEVFHISEESRKEYERIKTELEDLKEKVAVVIEEGDQLEINSKAARRKLSVVSRNFSVYSEDKIREAYDNAHKIQSEFIVKRDKEKALRERRDDLELRLKSIEKMVERAEGLMGKISIVLNYLSEDFKHISDLLQNAQEKQAFGLQIIEAQEEERRKLSREMHDGPAQMLANILLRSEIVDRTYRKGDTESAMKEMRNVRTLIRSSLQEVRRIIYDLRPMALDDLGLVPTIKKYIATLEEQHPNIHFQYRAKEERLASQYEVALFRLIQESIQNAIKHAKAERIDVKLEIVKDYVTAVIKDNGIGFDRSQKKDKSFGLIGMNERIDMLGGELDIVTKVGEGTKIYIKIPLSS
ncbi:two-component system, NarL family, sensor histidine kinase DegS [Gracilibacillus ureilyticus]|uniref:Signal transduction histidine-protein kinase/phosphatase DegS n=1 Tax=Gracilibacillus ureilyticus TaxID=531814 RepID=A0A1H9NYX5_9BACI|nr:sensor histidine kinase [Gracilibacillus ureilyticus]SER41017.1 two-component system, NarL family, sensor histidine kinase DegS [Gracilibacillus ureilyticus]